MKTLFIGNSHTYFNNMPKIFAELCLRSGIDMHVTMLAHPNWRLAQHVADPECRFNLLFGEYDFAVIQQGAHPFPGEESLLKDGGTLMNLARKGNAIPCAYMTWPEKRFPENRMGMRNAYIRLAQENQAVLCSVGDAFYQAGEQGIDVYDGDGEHPNPAGSYLAACVFLKTLIKQDPRGLPGQLPFQDEMLCNLDAKTTTILQRIAATMPEV